MRPVDAPGMSEGEEVSWAFQRPEAVKPIKAWKSASEKGTTSSPSTYFCNTFYQHCFNHIKSQDRISGRIFLEQFR